MILNHLDDLYALIYISAKRYIYIYIYIYNQNLNNAVKLAFWLNLAVLFLLQPAFNLPLVYSCARILIMLDFMGLLVLTRFCVISVVDVLKRRLLTSTVE